MKKYLALKASAGSGKTFSLTVRYISLLLKDVNISEILTLTFTNKAANEMSERIQNTLLNLGKDEVYLQAIVKESGLNKNEILYKKNNLLKTFLNANLSIFTIDKFISKILREFCAYLGISDDFEIKEDNLEALSIKFLQSLDEKTFETLIDFSLYEKKKFNSIFDLFKNLLEKNENLKTVNIEANLIKLQKQKVLEEGFKIKEFILNCPVASNAVKKAVDFETFEELFIKPWLEKESLSSHSYFKKCTNDTLEEYFKNLKEQMGNYYILREGYSLNKLFELYKKFKEFKFIFNKTKNYLEFNDISNLVYELLSTKIDKEFLYFRLDSKYSHILIDEFQDTSLQQYKILEPLINEILAGDQNTFKTFFYVGDTKQSIYRFRGGKRELFDYVAKNNNSLEVEILNINYRSKENIINFVNDSFLTLKNYEYYKQDSISKGGYVEVIEDKSLEENDKFKNIALNIAKLLKEGVNAKDIAILTYTNDDVLKLYYYLKEKFPTLNISTEMTSKLINQVNVKTLINAIKYLYFQENIYKENLNALMGKKICSILDFKMTFENKSIQEIIKELSNYLQIVDENIIRLIEISNKFNNLIDFIYEIDKLDTSIENSKQSGLQILTIFKSKGLEFHTVILLDRIKRKNIDKSSLLFEYEKIELKNIFYKIKSYENYNISYKTALKKEKNLILEDELNILYVALTRAKNNLLIFKKEKNSVFDNLQLKTMQIGNIIKSEDEIKNKKRISKIVYKSLNLGVQEKPIENSNDFDTDILYARYFGIATHYCLEMMNSFTDETLQKAINLTKSRYLNYLNKSDFLDIKNRINNLIKNNFFNNLIKNAEFITEQSLIYKGEIKIIDLLLYKNNKYYIFDYKTTSEKKYEHIKQVKFYQKAIIEIFKTKEVYPYLIYLKKDNVHIDEVF